MDTFPGMKNYKSWSPLCHYFLIGSKLKIVAGTNGKLGSLEWIFSFSVVSHFLILNNKWHDFITAQNSL